MPSCASASPFSSTDRREALQRPVVVAEASLHSPQPRPGLGVVGPDRHRGLVHGEGLLVVAELAVSTSWRRAATNGSSGVARNAVCTRRYSLARSPRAAYRRAAPSSAAVFDAVGGDRPLELLQRAPTLTPRAVHERQRHQGVVHPIAGLDRALRVLRGGVRPRGVVRAQVTVHVGEETEGRIVLQGEVTGRLQRRQEHGVSPLEAVLPERPLQRVQRGRPLAATRLGQRRDEQRVVVVGLELQHPPRLRQGLVVLPTRQGDLGQRQRRGQRLWMLRELAPRQRLRQLVVARQQRARRRGLPRLDRGRHARAVPASRAAEITDEIVSEAPRAAGQESAEEAHVHPADPIEGGQAHQQDDAGDPSVYR